MSHNPKYVRAYYGESSAVYPLLLAAAEKVDEFVKLLLITANTQQISIFHSLRTSNGSKISLFFSPTCEVSPLEFIVIHLYLLVD